MKPDPRVRVLVTMRSLVFLTLVACGGTKPKQEPMSGSGSAEPVVVDTRPELVKRRDGACEKLRPRLVQCAVDDTKAEFDAGKITKKQFDEDTAPGVKLKLGSEWMKACQVEMSSRQVRVLEICDREEQECGPLVSCLAHLNEAAK